MPQNEKKEGKKNEISFIVELQGEQMLIVDELGKFVWLGWEFRVLWPMKIDPKQDELFSFAWQLEDKASLDLGVEEHKKVVTCLWTNILLKKAIHAATTMQSYTISKYWSTRVNTCCYLLNCSNQCIKFSTRYIVHRL